MNFRAASVLIAALVVTSCSGGLRTAGEGDGWTRTYEPGVPEFDLEVVPTGPGAAEARIGLIPGALVHRRTEDGYLRASVRFQLTLDGETIHETEDSLTASDPEAARAYRRVLRAIPIEAEPEAVVAVRLEDRATGRTASRQVRLRWVEGDGARIGQPGLRSGSASRVGLELRKGYATTEVHAWLESSVPGCLDWTLLAVPTDTSVARLPFALSAGYGSLEYRGALYGSADSLHVRTDTLTAGAREVSLALPDGLPLGVHRVELSWRSRCRAVSELVPALTTGRSVLVRPAGFPRVVHLDQLIEALTYLATDGEMDQIRSAPDAVSRKDAYDAFWGRTVGDPALAARTLERFYGRIEEANRQFSSFKEGWKTDRGMIYVVMGPPLYAEDSVDELRWFYSYDERNAGRYFVFERVRGFPDELDLPQYSLQRSMEQEREWRLAVQRWRRGAVR